MTKTVLKLKVTKESTIKSDVDNITKKYKVGDEISINSDDNGQIPGWIKSIVEEIKPATSSSSAEAGASAAVPKK